MDHKGAVKLDKHKYYAGRELAGQYVSLEREANSREVVVVNAKNLQTVKRLPIKGLCRTEMSFEDYTAHILREAKSERRLAQFRNFLRRNSEEAA